jgi:hypothetical protein
VSHKSGHIIIQAIKPLPSVTPEQRRTLEEIEARDEYTFQDRLYLGYIASKVAPLPAD